MPRIFILDRRNYKICLENRLFGVPDSFRAISQIKTVRKGDFLFTYITKEKQLMGVYEADSEVFRDAHAERGPWKGRAWDKKKGFYPHRIKIKILEPFTKGISIDELETMRIGISENKFKGNSVVSLTGEQTQAVLKALEEKNVGYELWKPSPIREFQSTPTTPISAFDFPEGEESQLQLLVQDNISQLESGLHVFDTYYNVRDYLGKVGYEGEIDILANDSANQFVVLELKKGKLPKDIWSQLFSYTYVIRNTLAKGAEVRAMAVCRDIGRETKYAYPELKRKLQDKNTLKVFTYDLKVSQRKISFDEVHV